MHGMRAALELLLTLTSGQRMTAAGVQAEPALKEQRKDAALSRSKCSWCMAHCCNVAMHNNT
jgi:hypothetical protein